MVKKLGLFIGVMFLSLCLGAISALACRNSIGVYSTLGDGASVSCSLTGQDANWCYYDCTCTGTDARCDQLYAAAGLVDA